jgi:DNA invertase Pin-like site-specific DNA recombinase
MTIYGYARVSTADQDTGLQEAALKAAGASLVRSEKVSGTKLDGRTELDLLLAFLRPGDTLMVTRIDRLARSIRDLQNIVFDLRSKGIALRATEQPVDTSTAAGKCFLDMLGVFAEFETNLRRERQLEGIAAAKAAGKYRGRKRQIDAAAIAALAAEGLGPTAIAERLGINRASVFLRCPRGIGLFHIVNIFTTSRSAAYFAATVIHSASATTFRTNPVVARAWPVCLTSRLARLDL